MLRSRSALFAPAAFCLALLALRCPQALAHETTQPATTQAAYPGDDRSLRVSQQRVFRTALATVRPSIVRIDTIGGAQPVTTGGDDAAAIIGFRQADGPTTGVIWSADGYIITSSFNFVRDPVVISVTLDDGRRFVAQRVARDRPAGLTLLKIDAADLPTPSWASLEDLEPGQWTLAAGYGLNTAQPALTVGVLSAARRQSDIAAQTDAKISPTNYGGPLFDLHGRVIGVCVALGAAEDEQAAIEWYDAGTAFAIRHDYLAARVLRLTAGVDLFRGHVGVEFGPESEPVVRAAAATQPTTTPSRPDGIRIGAEPLNPAAAAGLREGDWIVALDAVPTTTPLEFRRALARRAAGDTIQIRFWRDGVLNDTSLRLVRREELKPATSQPG